MSVYFNAAHQIPSVPNTEADLTKSPRIMNASQARASAKKFFALGQLAQSSKMIIDCLAIHDLVKHKVKSNPISKASKLSDDEQLTPVLNIALALVFSGLCLVHFTYKHHFPAPKQTELPKQEPLD